MRVPSTAAAALAAALLLAGCGSGADEPAAKDTPTAAPDLAAGPWLLRFNAEGGAEGQITRAVYVTYTPSTGVTTVQRLPALSAPDTYSDRQAVLVSGDRSTALLDSAVPRADGRRGRVATYPTAPGERALVDVRALTGDTSLVPVAAAFDPAADRTLRVVDTQRRVWRLDLLAATGEREGDLPRRAGWIYANGFDKNTGLPYIEATDTDETLPAGNGYDDVRPVERSGGTLRLDDGTEDPDLPALPCGFSAGFDTADGTTWLFCADTARVEAYRLADGADAWEKVGTPSAAVVPASAAEIPVVLPPSS